MGFWTRLLGSERRSAPVGISPSDPFMMERLGGRRAGIVGYGGPDQALSTLAVAARCVALISDGLASVPLSVMRKQADGGRLPADTHPISRLLNEQANPGMSGFEFRELLVRDVASHGNGFARIDWDGRGAAAGLYWLPARLTAVDRLPNGRLRYRSSDPLTGAATILLQDEILHIRHASRDGLLGVSPMALAAGSVGLALAQSELAHDQVTRGFVPDVTFEMDGSFAVGDIADGAFRRLKEQLASKIGMMRRDGEPLLLEGGLKAKPLTATGREAQFQEARVLGLEDVARAFGVPLSVVGLGQSGSYGSLTEESRSLVAYSLSPWAKRIETQLALSLLSEQGRRDFSIEHDLSGLQRGDMQARLQSYAVGVVNGIFSPNECRRWEGLNSRPGGDAFLTPMNMQPNTTAAQV